MIELPEAVTLARQLADTLTGRTIRRAQAASSPHGFAWYFGDPAEYDQRLAGRTITGAVARGGLPEICADDMRVCFADGVNVRYLAPGTAVPAKHQLLLDFDDGSAIVCTVQMYGGLWAFHEGLNGNPYYLVADEKPSPLDGRFDAGYFESLLAGCPAQMSAKAVLATQQRIPGLGNGVLQDVLWRAGVHPKRKLGTVPAAGREKLYDAVKTVLAEMVAGGGRSSEKDLFGDPGGYTVAMGGKTLGTGCPACGTPIQKLSYLGGAVYVCETCQPLG